MNPNASEKTFKHISMTKKVSRKQFMQQYIQPSTLFCVVPFKVNASFGIPNSENITTHKKIVMLTIKLSIRELRENRKLQFCKSPLDLVIYLFLTSFHRPILKSFDFKMCPFFELLLDKSHIVLGLILFDQLQSKFLIQMRMFKVYLL